MNEEDKRQIERHAWIQAYATILGGLFAANQSATLSHVGLRERATLETNVAFNEARSAS
jgi:hypothetical protein